MVLTERFYLDPFEVENKSFEHFCDIVSNLISHDRRNDKDKKSKTKIKRKAGDDWF